MTPAEIAATVYQGLGIDLATELPGPQGQPIRPVYHGVDPIQGVVLNRSRSRAR